MSLGCMEPQFFATFIDRFNAALRINGRKTEWTPTRAKQFTKDDWPKLRKYIADGFKALPRDYWADVFHGGCRTWIPMRSVSIVRSILGVVSRFGRVCGAGVDARGSRVD